MSPLFKFKTITGESAVPIADVQAIADSETTLRDGKIVHTSTIYTDSLDYTSTEPAGELVERFNNLLWSFTGAR